jgi:uncharacterized YccA/Bax inhibitor family protein
MSNPILTASRLEEFVGTTTNHMTINGTGFKAVLLTLITLITGCASWVLAPTIGMIPAIVGAILGLVIVLITCFKPQSAPILSPVYAVCEGTFLGVISSIYNAQAQGIPMQALLLTFGTLFGMLFLYQTRIITVTNALRSTILGATFAIAGFYLISMVVSLFGVPIPYLSGSSPLAIGINVVIAGIAAFNFLLDFDTIERGAAHQAPKYFEWFAAMGLLITIVWLYVEFLRLLSKLRR